MKKTLITGAALALAMGTGNAAEEPKQNEKPNIIFIIADDFNNWIENTGRHPQVVTPNITELREQGIYFRNAHSNNTVCSPSRASLFTGLYPHTTGYFGYNQHPNNWRNFEKMKDAVTMMEHFYNHGYNIYGTGKLFHGGHEDWSVFKGDNRIDHFGAMPDFGPWAWDGQQGTNEDGEIEEPWRSRMIHPDQLEHWGQRRSPFGGFGSLANIPEYPPNEETGAPGYKGWILNGEPFHYEDDNNRDLMPDEKSVEYAKKVLGDEHNKPFLLAVGFNRPHTPFYAPQKYFDLYPLEGLKLPQVKEDDLEDCASMLWNPCQTAHCNGFWGFRQVKNHPKPQMWLRMVQAYLACISFVDDMVGELMETLKESEYADNTIIIFTSDHGFHLGEKQYRAKGTLWEESSIVPFIFWSNDLEHAGAAVDHPISLIDIYPTFVDYAGLPDNPNAHTNGLPLDGYSLRPFIEDPVNGTWDGPDFALISVASGEHLEINEPGMTERQFYSLRTLQYRYTLTPNGEQELYDHFRDPYEWTNLAQKEEYQDLLTKFRLQLWDFINKNN